MKKRFITINVMASLLTGDPLNPSSAESIEARAKFIAFLRKMKRLGVQGVSIDLWWGLLQPEEGPIDWTKPGPAYYDWIINTIIAEGLMVVPILSFHQCGGNVGDDVFVPIPAWVWTKLARLLGDADYAKFVSEQGNACPEYVSFWATHLILDDYLAVVKAFRDHFADRAQHISEINISLGPAGELRYPSYNSHDKGVDYPTRGALQCYSKMALESFRAWALDKYGSLEAIDAKWNTNLAGGQKLLPPSNPKQFFADSDHVDMQYGRDFFDWYAEQPHKHARLVLKGVFDILAADDSPMKGIDIGVKVPGIHWLSGRWVYDAEVTSAQLQQEISEIVRSHTEANLKGTDATAYGAVLATKIADHVRERTRNWTPAVDGGVLKLGSRLAELAAGLIRTSNHEDWEKDDAGRGYRPLVKLFSEFENNANSRLVMHFTCLEMADGENAERGAESVASSLVSWVGEEATRQGVPIKGENAVSWTLPDRSAWARMRSHLKLQSLEEQHSQVDRHAVVQLGGHKRSVPGQSAVRLGSYEGLTILRMSNVAEDPVAYAEMAKTVAYVADPNELTAPPASTVEGKIAGSLPVPGTQASKALEPPAPAAADIIGRVELPTAPAKEEKVA
jgi:hypothetical protein